MKFLVNTFLLWLLAVPLLGQDAAEVRGTVRGADGEALASVSVFVVGGRTGTLTGSNGAYRLTVQPGAKLRFGLIGYAQQEVTVPAPVNGVATLDVTLAEADLSTDEVIIVGSRATGRTKLTSAVPVDVINFREAIVNAPQTDIAQLLTYAAPSFQSNRQSTSDETEHIDPISLRGMGPDQTLVLINGKRRHLSSVVFASGTFGRGTVGTDLGAIPTAAIDRIEVLRDGAAALYGSDAIAGVINIVLREETNRLTAVATAGQYSAGDGALGQFSLNYGTSIGRGGFLNVTGQYTDRGFTNRTEEHELDIFGSSFAYPFDPAARGLDNATLAARGLRRSDFNFRIGDAAIQSAQLFLNTVIPIDNQGSEFYAFGGLSNKIGRGSPFRRLPSDFANVASIYPNGFLPETQSDVADQSIAAGIRTNWQGWNVDVSNTFGRNRFDFTINNTLNTSLRAESPTSFYAGGFAFSQNVTNLTLNRRFEELAGINVALGAEYRVDRYQLFAGEEGSWRNYGIVDSVGADGFVAGQVDRLGLPGGAQGYPGFRPEDEVDVNRTNAAAFLEVDVNVTPEWLVSVAGRYEKYSDFGDTWNGKIASSYRFGDFLTLRGALSTGFRAPALQQVYFNKVTTDLANGRLVEVGTFRNTSRVARILGVPELQEETSVNYSLGFALRPLEGLSVTVDAYQIDVDDRIIYTSTFDASSLPASVATQLRNAGVERVNFFANAIDTRTRGIDIVGNYEARVGEGRLGAILAVNFNEVTIRGDVRTSPQLAGQSETYLQPWDRLRIEQNNPRNKTTATLTYHLGKFQALVRGVRFGSVTLQPGEAFGVRQTYSPQYVLDASVGYELLQGLTLTVGGNNILDAYPDRQAYDNSYFRVFTYPPIQQGFNGAFWFTRLTYNY